MSAFGYIKSVVLPAAMLMLPTKMDTPEARSMLLSIGLQESRFTFRRQVGGPAVSFWQFEMNGIRGVLNHQATRSIIEQILGEMQYGTTADISYSAIPHNDVLAAIYARLLLWTLPSALPGQDETEKAFDQYLNAWRPGVPRRATWADNYAMAWSGMSQA